ncbi:MAG: hypothetical protein CMD16_04340 [Flavobacteriales bacterium]|nr:hypothetical protein [Flavobacteriales bacterium]|tara:strand:- start:13571 stop:17152 length:3582 start_codon:yes stop_codon:yes gene_type:complete
MRNRILLLIFGVLLSANFGLAQECGTYEGSFEEQVRKYPDFYKSLEAKNLEIELKHKKALSKMTSFKNENGVKIIPVVVHVIHNGGAENLTMDEIQNGLDHLNKNINGQADNFLDSIGVLPRTPDIFASVRGNLNVEFRLAKKDPLGNPTSGVVRVESELTVATVTEELSRDRVKALSYWNSFQYFNIWVVKDMPENNAIDEPGLNGYAQFPYTGSMSTDGVMIRSDRLNIGKTITHEVGHWLGLCHTWDCGPVECGTDNVADTPEDKEGTFDWDGSFPFHVGNIGIDGGCLPDSLNPAGEMYMNYMDYQNDNIQTMFTKGQDAIMNEVLDGIYDNETGETGLGYREYMWSPENIEATGVGNGYIPPACIDTADFVLSPGAWGTSLCKDASIRLIANSELFDDIISWSWDMGDGTVLPGQRTVLHAYNDESPNNDPYDVTLNIEYNETTKVRAPNLSDLDASTAISITSDTMTLCVQGTLEELNDLGANNISLHIDKEGYSLDSYWKKSYFTVDSLVGAFNIDTFNLHHFEDTVVLYLSNTLTPDSVLIDTQDSIYVYIDGYDLTPADLVLLETPENAAADSSTIFISNLYVDYLDSIVDYNFYYDTSIVNIFTYIDSTFLSYSDSSVLNSADTTWMIDGVLTLTDSISILTFNDSTYLTSSDSILIFTTADSNWVDSGAVVASTDSIRTYFGQFNDTTSFSFLTYIDSTYLTSSDSLFIFTTADSSWSVDSLLQTDSVRVYFAQFNDTTYLDFLTYIDSTYLTPSDSMVLNLSDSSWVINSTLDNLDSTMTYYGIFNHIDSITMYFAQFRDTTITLSINTDTNSLSAADSLMFYTADSTWSVNAFVGWVDTVRTLYGSHYYTKYSGYYADTLFYRGEIEKVTYTASYQNTCSTSKTKVDYVTVHPTVAELNSSSYSYSFENELDLGADWVINNPDHIGSSWNFNADNSTTWEWADGVAIDGVSSIKIDGEDMVIGASTEIISKAFDLSNLTNPAIKFSWSGAAVNTFPRNKLSLYYSDDCGKTWDAVVLLSNEDVANAGLYTIDFKPDTTQWTDTILTDPSWSGNENIRFKFEYAVEGSSNNFYLDNIRIGEASALMLDDAVSNYRISIFPNLIDQNSSTATIALENLENLNVDISLINILGSKVRKIYNGEIISRYEEVMLDDLYDLESGVYFVEVVNNGDIILTDKLIIK